MVDTDNKIKILNPKSLTIEFKMPIKKEYLDKFHLSKIQYDEKNEIKIGDKINVSFNLPTSQYSTYFIANYMYKEDINKIRINEFESNVSSTYILPLLGFSKNQLLIDYNLINVYAKHHSFDYEIGKYVYLVYRYMPISYYEKFVNALSNREDCLIRRKEGRFDIFVFKVNKHTEDIKKILDGKYSSITKEAKDKILKFHNQAKPETPLYQILYKGNLRKNELEQYLGTIIPEDIDLAEKPNMEEETWKE